jgi:hypothetical protein
MSFLNYSACFFAGMFLANGVPHFVKGICGDRFPTPFAKPPGRGLSSPIVNVVWGLANLIVGAVLWRAGRVAGGDHLGMVIFVAGIAVLSVPMSLHFAKKHGE